MLDTCLCFPREMETGYYLYLPTLTMVVLQASQMEQIVVMFLISDFRHDLNTVYLLLGISPASNCSWPTFWNPVSVPSSKTGCTVYTQPLKMELIQGSETSANYNLTLGKYPEENIQCCYVVCYSTVVC